jgi:hypothetical protein
MSSQPRSGFISRAAGFPGGEALILAPAMRRSEAAG